MYPNYVKNINVEKLISTYALISKYKNSLSTIVLDDIYLISNYFNFKEFKYR